MSQDQVNFVMLPDLAQSVMEYLNDKPYKVSKPIIDNIKEIPLDNGQKGYVMDRQMVVHLLDDVMIKEDLVRTYMLMRKGYEDVIREDTRRKDEARAEDGAEDRAEDGAEDGAEGIAEGRAEDGAEGRAEDGAEGGAEVEADQEDKKNIDDGAADNVPTPVDADAEE